MQNGSLAAIRMSLLVRERAARLHLLQNFTGSLFTSRAGADHVSRVDATWTELYSPTRLTTGDLGRRARLLQRLDFFLQCLDLPRLLSKAATAMRLYP